MTHTDNRTVLSKVLVAAAAAGLLALGPACDSLETDNLNRPAIDSLIKNPTRTSVMAATTGLLIGTRMQMYQTNGYVSMLGILGRESYCTDKADPRFVAEMLEASALDPSSPAFGGNFWQQPYENIRNANYVLDALSVVPNVTDEEKAAVRGFSKTIQAVDFLIIHNTRWTNGGPVAVDRTIAEGPAPLVSKDELLAYAAKILDEGEDDLTTAAAGSDTFPFLLSQGFADFDTPSTFLKFNRAIKTRVAVYQKDWAAADAAIDGSFLSTTFTDVEKGLAFGAYHSFGTGSGDVLNGLGNPTIVAHPKIYDDAEYAGAQIDRRVAKKIRQLDAPEELRDVSSDKGFTMYDSPTAPLAIIRNEELILLRAEILYQLRATPGNLAGAISDINFIRIVSGGLNARNDLDANNFLDELLKQRRYSLMFEYGHRWIDLRRYDRLGDPSLLDLPTHHVHVAFPLPLPEVEARQ
jgi:hypothetical protein